MRIRLIGIVIGSVIARGASAQVPPRPTAAATPVGVWRGTSACLVRPSACNEEIVVYRITQAAADSVAVDARKIVRGEEQEMGVLRCHLAPHVGQISCAIPQGTWHFTVRGDSLVGELRLADSTKFRQVAARRAR
jgi:hypothetical protein